MADAGTVTKKIARIRTFRGDVELARGGGAAAAPRTAVPAAPPPTQPAPSGQTIFRAPATPPAPVPVKPKSEASDIPSPAMREVPAAAITQPAAPKDPSLSVPVPPPTPLPSKGPAILTPAKSEPAPPMATLQSLAAGNEDELSVLDDSDSYIADGNIITDQKRDRFSLLPSIWQSIRSWFAEEKEAMEEKAAEKRRSIPTVRSIEERRAIVEKAAKQSALAPKDDYRQLQAKLPPIAREKVPEAAPIIVRGKSEAPKPGWSHFTDSQGREVPEAAPKATPAIPPEPAKIVAAPAIPPVIPPPPVETKLPTEAAAPTPEEPPVVIEAKPAPPPAAEPAAPPAPPEAAPRKPEVKVVGRRSSGQSLLWLGRAAVYAATVLVSISAAAAGAGLVWWLIGSAGPGAPTVQTPAPEAAAALINYDERVDLPLPARREELWQGILSAPGRGGAEVALINPVMSGGAAATTAEILAVMNLRASAAFLRNINEVNFGRFRDKPFIVFNITAFDTAFGGILSAESTLPADLTLFGTADASSIYRFVDDIVQNHDVRILQNELGQEGFVYGFVNRTTLLIAADRDVFAGAARRVR